MPPSLVGAADQYLATTSRKGSDASGSTHLQPRRFRFLGKLHKERNGREVGSSFTCSRSKLITVPLQIKNLVSTAHALAIQEGCQVTMSHLEVAITACEDFEYDFKGAGPTEVLNSYF
jgi:hypothetical protein